MTERLPSDREVYGLLQRLDERTANQVENANETRKAIADINAKLESFDSKFVSRAEQNASYRMIGIMIAVGTIIVTLVQILIARGGP